MGKGDGKMKMPVKWHEERLKNSIDSANLLRIELESKAKALLAFEIENQFYADQIHFAKIDEKEAFDRERYGVKKGGKP